jgi:hypothetical protein
MLMAMQPTTSYKLKSLYNIVNLEAKAAEEEQSRVMVYLQCPGSKGHLDHLNYHYTPLDQST